MTKQETMQVLQSIEDRAVDFPNMTECDWVAIAAAKRHLENSIEVKEVDINKEISQFIDANFEKATIGHKLSLRRTAKYFFELGIAASNREEKGEQYDRQSTENP